MISRNNMFIYGEVGERLGGIRESEIYSQSAQIIENLIINEMGNLKIAKDFEFQSFAESLIDLIDTKYEFYVGVTKSKYIVTYRKNNGKPDGELARHQTTVNNIRIIRICDDKLFIIGDTIQVFEFNKNNGTIGTSNFLNLIKLPIKEKENIKIDIYRVYQVQSELRVSLLGSYENPKFDTTGNNLKIEGSGIVLSRLYKQYKASVTKDNITGITNGLTFGVMHGYYQTDSEKKYLIGNTEIELTNEVNDSVYGGSYFTKVNKVASGELTFGKVIRINQDITTVGIYQDRLVIVNDGVLYFSNKSNYFDFKNDTSIDSAFFFKPTPINNIYPKIYDIFVGDKIYATTSQGVYVISANNILSSNSYAVFIASELPAKEDSKYSYKNNSVLLNNVFYYLTSSNELRAIEQIPSSQGIESYSTTLVEKYELRAEFSNIAKLKYNNKQYLVAYRAINNEISKLYMYEHLDYKMFRRFSLNLKKSLNGINSIVFCNKYIICETKGNSQINIISESTLNVEKCLLRLNPPNLSVENGGNYNNDYSSKIERVFIKVLNENKQAIKGIKIGDHLVTKSAIEDDLFSVFKVETSERVLNGFNIEITSNQNNNIFEILGIDLTILIAGD